MLSKELEEILKTKKRDITFCFYFKSKTKELHLASSNEIIKINEYIFVPYSAIELKEAKFDDSGMCEVILSGFFEKNSVENKEDLEDLYVKIFIYEKSCNILEEWLELKLVETKTNLASFTIRLVHILKKDSHNFLSLYSRTCRANFGDEKCGIDLSLYPGETCDKTFTICCNKFNNAINFRGEPFVPTIEYFDRLDE